ncbi:MAG: hypothetical protein E6Q97_32540 [Desulfurellales bacterium]|nr:MAG: hypothetical protein E6Q97_32540 [Desulfurellales bacterium]
MKFCKDCKWMRLEAGDSIRFAQCVHPDVADYDPVSGELRTFCKMEREKFGSSTSKCGPNGNLWQQFQPGVFEVVK